MNVNLREYLFDTTHYNSDWIKVYRKHQSQLSLKDQSSSPDYARNYKGLRHPLSLAGPAISTGLFPSRNNGADYKIDRFPCLHTDQQRGISSEAVILTGRCQPAQDKAFRRTRFAHFAPATFFDPTCLFRMCARYRHTLTPLSGLHIEQYSGGVSCR